ncbi:thioesterase II family protein [Streptomyces wuyuanensis]|uniref:thioesterase II family protein n=1 Tax=Streptomyces wuyuanensis TaxID=1196353 RepID=UPI0037181A99
MRSAALSRFRHLPLVLFGHSLGASVTFEVCPELEQRFNFRPLRLIVSGQEPPHIALRGSKCSDDDDALISDIRRLSEGTVGPLGNPDLRELTFPAIRVDFRLIDSYRPQPIKKITASLTAHVRERAPDRYLKTPENGTWRPTSSSTPNVHSREFSSIKCGEEVTSSLLKDIGHPHHYALDDSRTSSRH